MHNPRAAEWLIARLTNRKRAAEIIGDLLEQQPRHFTLAIARIVFALTWRWMLACTAATFSGLLVLWPHIFFIQSRYPARHFAPAQPWMVWSGYFMDLAVFLITLTTLALIRYGYQSLLFRVGATITLFVSCASCLTWTTHSAITLSAGSTVVLIAVVLLPRWARALGCLLTSAAAMGLILLLLGYAQDWLLPTSLHHATEPYAILGWPLSIAIGAVVLARLQQFIAGPINEGAHHG